MRSRSRRPRRGAVSAVQPATKASLSDAGPALQDFAQVIEELTGFDIWYGALAARAAGEPTRARFDDDLPVAHGVHLADLDTAQRETVTSALARAIDEGSPFSASLQLPATSGVSPRSISTQSRVVRDVNGQDWLVGVSNAGEAGAPLASGAAVMAALSSYTNELGHEFNNLLASVLGYSRLAQRALTLDKADKLPAYLEDVRLCGERARDMVEDLLVFARGGHQTFEDIALADLASDIESALRATLAAGIELDVASSPPPPAATVAGSRELLLRVVSAIAANANVALDGRGHVRLSLAPRAGAVDCASCHPRASGDWWLIAIENDGPDLVPDLQAHLFEPYRSGHDGSRGMGLAIVHGIVHQHGGHLYVASRAPRGVRFGILLPLLTPRATNCDDQPR